MCTEKYTRFFYYLIRKRRLAVRGAGEGLC
nr:MAG TPA: hypothetical protein [Caudoviricetes sp.]